jgi:hypothetical protein
MTEPRWNHYHCGSCGKYFVTVQVDEGSTPSTLSCMMGCNDQQPKLGGSEGWRPIVMLSAFNRAPHLWHPHCPRKAHAEWYKPKGIELAQIKKKAPGLAKHIIDGGLILRKAHKDTPAFPSVAH